MTAAPIVPGLAAANDASPPRLPRWDLRADGVYYVSRNPKTGEEEERWICAPMQVIARARTTEGKGYARVVSWRSPRGDEHELVVHDSGLVVGSGEDVLRELADRGLAFRHRTGRSVLDYIQHERPDRWITSTKSAGWVDGADVYVASDGQTYGRGGDGYRYVPQRGEESALASAGTLADWRAHVGARCVGNPLLALAVSTAFAAPLLRLLGGQGGGWHFVGASSTGKTTAVEVAASVCGYPAASDVSRKGYVRSWDATKNGLGLLAMQHNDSLLAVDEIGQASPRDVGEALYLIANGVERTRSSADGTIRGGGRWSLLMLSSGEKDVTSTVEEGGKTPKAGQDARLPSIPVRGKHGAFETLHGANDGKSFAVALGRATRTHYGTAWPAWLDHLTELGRAAVTDRTRELVTKFEDVARCHLGMAPSGEVYRVVTRFALCAAAGEMASTAGITGWPGGEAERAAEWCLLEWLDRRDGSGSSDIRNLKRHVRSIIERDLDTRFDLRLPLADSGSPIVGEVDPRPKRDLLGFRDVAAGLAYVQPETFTSALVKYTDKDTAVKALIECGWIVTDGGRSTKKVHIPARGGSVRVYVLDIRKVLGVEDDASGGPA